MPISRYFTTPVTITNPSLVSAGTTTDAEGVPTTTTTTVATSGHVQPYRAGQGDEEVLGAEEATRARTLWLPLDTAIGHRSTVLLRGDRYQVHGDPKDWRVGSPNDHLEVTIVRQVASS